MGTGRSRIRTTTSGVLILARRRVGVAPNWRSAGRYRSRQESPLLRLHWHRSSVAIELWRAKKPPAEPGATNVLISRSEMTTKALRSLDGFATGFREHRLQYRWIGCGAYHLHTAIAKSGFPGGPILAQS